MQLHEAPPVDPWRLEILTVRDHSHTGAERRALHRDTVGGLLLRLRQGAYVERAAFESLSPEARHVVRLRALVALADGPVVFSHWSAAVLHRLPVLRSRLTAVHVTVATAGSRARGGVAAHVFCLREGETTLVGGLLTTGLGRTVVDLAGACGLEEGVMAADAVLAAGVPREMLEAAMDLAGPRRAGRRIADAVAFAHPGAESALESRGRTTLFRIGTEVPELQHRIVLDDGGAVWLDFYFAGAHAAAEADGDVKYLDREMAPEGAARAVIAEKRREDEVRSRLRGLARFGWLQSGSIPLLRDVLARAGVVATKPRPVLADWCIAAAAARPRRRPRDRAEARSADATASG